MIERQQKYDEGEAKTVSALALHLFLTALFTTYECNKGLFPSKARYHQFLQTHLVEGAQVRTASQNCTNSMLAFRSLCQTHDS